MKLLPAAIAIILNSDKTKVLLVKRADVPVWVLPGGGIENKEKAEEALLREVQEETGYRVQIVRQCAKYFPANALSAVTSVFICTIKCGKMRLSSETKAINFYSLKDLPSNFFPPHALWLKEALSTSFLIQRNLKEISYLALARYFIRHPWQVLRFTWTRFIKRST